MSQVSQKGKDRISPANIIALLGIAGIGVISGIGALLNTDDGAITWPIIWAIITMAVLGGFLCIAIIAKGKGSHRELWTKVMWSSVVIYILAAIMMCGPFLKFFYVADQKDKLQEQAQYEIAHMDSIFDNYNKQREEFLGNAKGQLESAFIKSNKESISPELKEYYDNRIIGNIENWMTSIAIPTTNISKLRNPEKWKELKTKVNKWNYLKLPQLAIDLKTMQENTWKMLNEKIKKYGENQELIPVINTGNNYRYHYIGIAEFDLGKAPESKFADQLSEQNNAYTPMGIIAYVLLNLLVLFNVLVAPSSNIIGPKKREGITNNIGTRI